MKLGITIPNHWGVEDFRDVVRLAVLAEELGFDSVWVMDHLFNAGYIRARLEDKPYYHPLATLSFVAAKTERLTLGTSVIVLPYHNPFELAKYAATLDHMSGGRLVLGVGAGGMAEEFEALGVPMSRRGALSNESLAVMKELWTNPNPAFNGRFWRFDNVLFSPKPLQKPHIPLWVGGSSAGAKKRAALLGDGWHPVAPGVQEFENGCRQVREMAAAGGRDPACLTMSVRTNVRPGTVAYEQLVSDLQGYAACGAEHAVIALESGDVPALESEMRGLAREVLPAAR